MSTELFSAIRRPQRRAPLLLAVTAFVVPYFVLSFAVRLAFSEGNPRLGWILLSGIGLEAIVLLGVLVLVVRLGGPTALADDVLGDVRQLVGVPARIRS